MITDPRPLQPEFVPGDVRHRAGEINALTTTLDPITVGDHAQPSLLYGPSGTGKTCIARYAVKRLHENVLALDKQYINCWRDYTRFKTLYRALDGLDHSVTIHRQSTPRDELIDRLRDAVDDPYVVILDEVDQLEEKEVLYDLHDTPGLSLVLISNTDTEFFAGLEERIASRLRSATRIRFDRYGTDELVSILRDRVRWGLREDAVSDDMLKVIAESAAGDARVAIGTLLAAVQNGQQNGVDRLTRAEVEAAAPEAKEEIRRRNLEKLNADQRILYDIVYEREAIRPDDLYEVYCEETEDPRTRRTIRNYLKKMRRYNLVKATGEGKARRYCPV